MEFEAVDSVVRDLPGIPSKWGRRLYDFIVEHRPEQLLELGFWHGKSACYTAAALQKVGQGHLTTVDLTSALEHSPSITELLDQTGLSSFVSIETESTSYTWFLKKEIERAAHDGRTVPKYDLCFIDGAHSWEADGLAFFLCDKLLKDSGHMLFDDYSWSYGTSSALKNTERVRAMPADERDAMQVKLIYELLVKQHPNYGEFIVEEENWAWARKLRRQEASAVRTEVRMVSPVDAIKRKLGI